MSYVNETDNPVTFDQYSAVDWFAIMMSSAIMFLYHLFFILQTLLSPKETTLGANIIMRRKWVLQLHREKGEYMLGVHTLRNIISSCTFFASASSAFTVFLISHTTDQIGSNHIRFTQFILMSCLSACAFIAFAMASRLFSHLGFLLSIKDEEYEPHIVIEKLLNLVTGSTIHFSLGFRFLFMVIPFSMWVFSVWALLLSTIVVTLYLFYSDHSF
eukprot:TRINITY_DN3919_c0_g1_i1.p1 TRINITY_DN3919_c0_g1~~TRINITY_DN3919_c0_g1_i1.p1  ORF type:complete len:215 (+),score=14.19 TRINITY_DN3919_c0_g1_i1:36-680(+)